MEIRYVVALKILMIFLFTCTLSYADNEYIDDIFMIEASYSSGQKETQLWAIHLIGKENNEDTGLYLTVISLKGIDKDKFMIRGINNYSFNPSMDKLKYLKGSYIFELGMVTKLHLRIDINKDGSLEDVTGSETDTLSPANVTTFRLVKDQKEITIQEINKFPLKTYNYWVR